MANAFQKEGPVITPENAEEPARSESDILFDKLNESKWVRMVLFALTVLALLFYAYISPLPGENTVSAIRASICILFVSIALGIVYWQACGEDFCKNKVFAVSALAILFQLGLVTLLYRQADMFPDNLPWEKLVLPYIFTPLLVTVLLGPRMGTFSALTVSLLGIFYVTPQQTDQAQYLVTSLIAGMLTVYITRDVRSRSQLLKAGFFVGLLVLWMNVMMGFIQFKNPEIPWSVKAWGVLLSFSVSFVLSILIGGILPAIEVFFNIITPVSWLELTDMNHKLLKRLQLEAPGTFHHCVVVAQLAESAAEAIGANGNFCRVVSYYHDIGKVKQPQFFIENLIEGEPNPHDELTPTMSARIIIGHVSDGVELAREHKLKKPILEAIQQHHGVSLAYFFYRKALDYRKEMEEKVALGLAKLDDVPDVVESNFRYKGPIPQSKEVGIVSMADIVESATRSLHRPTYEELAQMIDSVLKARIVDGHLDESDLTLGDIHKIRDSFLNTLKNMRHTRISYPKAEEKPVEESSGEKEKEVPEEDRRERVETPETDTRKEKEQELRDAETAESIDEA